MMTYPNYGISRVVPLTPSATPASLDDFLVAVGVFVYKLLLICMLDQSLDVLWVSGVHHIEEELSVREVSCGSLQREELGKLGLRHEIADQVHDAQLVVLWELNRPLPLRRSPRNSSRRSSRGLSI